MPHDVISAVAVHKTVIQYLVLPELLSLCILMDGLLLSLNTTLGGQASSGWCLNDMFWLILELKLLHVLLFFVRNSLYYGTREP